MIEKAIQKYFSQFHATTKPIHLEELPLFLKSLYGFQQLVIHGESYLVILVKDKNLGPREFKKHAQLFKVKNNLSQIWFMHEMQYHKIQTLIENGMNFIVEGKQVYLPMLQVALKPETTPLREHVTSLNGLAINILERQILKNDLSGKNKLELANVFDVTQMTAGRAIEGLIVHELCHEKKMGVNKFIVFKDRAELWVYFRKFAKSPVKQFFFTAQKIPKLPFSGLTALSKKTLLADEEIPTYAIDKKDFRKTISKKDFVQKEFAKSKIEVWDRKPLLIEKNMINPLDIFTLLKNDSDERVQIELQGLLKKYDLDME